MDEIGNKTIKLIPACALTHLLNIYNASLKLSYTPETWKLAKIIVIPKNKADPDLPSSYRPISLLSCICKLLERIINSRLSDWAENKNILMKEQSGFRSKHSTQDIIFKLIESRYQ